MRLRWGFIPVLLLSCTISCSTRKDLLQANLLDHPNLALHIHPTLKIEILGERRVVPANIGITDKRLRVIHTHDSDGVLHVESPVPHQFVLGDFFTIWGKTFTGKCIFEYCADDDHVLEMFVNGEKTDLYENLPLRDKDQIKILYRKKEKDPFSQALSQSGTAW